MKTDWFKKGICCSNNAYASQVETKRFTANLMLEDGGFTAVDTLMSDGIDGSGCTVNIMDIRNAIDEGCSYLNYRGEAGRMAGSPIATGSTPIPFQISIVVGCTHL